ncbi:MAG: hypothetical protein FWF97_00320 [Alphaproteobacteria bacterium]|nr:hypothetical protein [Alphaproteobacteria bacterium]
MKKVLFLLGLFAPIIAQGADIGMEIQMLEQQIVKLRTERAGLISDLEKCDPAKAKSLAIAGGVLTGVAVVGSGVAIGQSVQKNKLEGQIDIANAKLAEKKEAERKAAQEAARKAEEAKREAEQRIAESKKAQEEQAEEERKEAKPKAKQPAAEENPDKEEPPQKEPVKEDSKEKDPKKEDIEEKEKEVKESEEQAKEIEKNEVKKCPKAVIDCTKSASFMNARGKNATAATQKCTDMDAGPKYANCIITACDDNYELKPTTDKGSSKCELKTTSKTTTTTTTTTNNTNSGTAAGFVEAIDTGVIYHGENASTDRMSKARATTGMSNLRIFATCTTTEGTYAQTGNPGTSFGPNCWCQGTNGGTAQQSSVWVFFATSRTPATCAESCASMCAHDSDAYLDLRKAVLSALAP